MPKLYGDIIKGKKVSVLRALKNKYESKNFPKKR